MSRRTETFLPTLREDPADSETTSHRLLLRAGMVRQLGAGLWTWLPAGYRSIAKAEAIIREEMVAIGGQEMLLPLMQPAEIWRETGRYGIGEMFKLQDR
ncbi:MAG: proline--tRNA ligase, partial [Solirubrobacterales bacterium]